MKEIKIDPNKYQIATSYTLGSEEKIIFSTRFYFIASIAFRFLFRYYKDKMFIWKNWRRQRDE